MCCSSPVISSCFPYGVWRCDCQYTVCLSLSIRLTVYVLVWSSPTLQMALVLQAGRPASATGDWGVLFYVFACVVCIFNA